MISLNRLLEIARSELCVDLNKVGARVISQMLPQHGFNRLRTVLLRKLGVRIGATSCFGGPLRISGSGSLTELLSVGPGCYISGPLHIDLMAGVRIGARVYIGYEVMLMTADHKIGPSVQRCGPDVKGAIEIGDGAWISSRVVVLPGVKVGRGAVVAAGAVVTKDVAPDTLVAGVPARVVRNLTREGSDGVTAPSDRRFRLATGGDAQVESDPKSAVVARHPRSSDEQAMERRSSG